MKVALVGIGERAQLQIPLVGVVFIELEVKVFIRRFHQRGILKSVAETKRAIMMEVVSQKHVLREMPAPTPLSERDAVPAMPW